jgi:hypothetical protein
MRLLITAGGGAIWLQRAAWSRDGGSGSVGWRLGARQATGSVNVRRDLRARQRF